MIMSDISVLSFLSHLMYVMDALTEIGVALKKDFTGQREAEARYRKSLSESRTGFNLTENEREYIDGIVSPLLLKGQSII